MNPPIVSSEAEVLTSDIDILSVDPVQLHAADVIDETFLVDVADSRINRTHSFETGLDFANSELAKLAKARYTSEELAAVDRFLMRKDTLDIPILRGYTVIVDGIERHIAMVAATLTDANHGEMSSMLYLRDQVQAINALMELFLQDPETYAAEGELAKELLISALHLMSTPAQLDRFEDVIQRGGEAGQEDWPHISLWFNDLDGVGPNKWRNKQDSFQMLAHVTLDAIDRGFLKPDELADAHKKFLSSIVPMLESVGFPNYENSGSWEEVEAKRTSVTAVETAMLHKMQILIEKDNAMDFLADGYGGDFRRTLDDMINSGLRELGRRLPDESPDYPRDSIKYRKADAALMYVLMYDLQQLLADREIPMAVNGGESMAAEDIECAVLSQLKKLINNETQGMYRYEPDSYLTGDYLTNAGQVVSKAIKHKVLKDAMRNGREIDLDDKQTLRNQLLGGKAAAWPHPIAQNASSAAKRGLAAPEDNEAYIDLQIDLSTRSLNAVLSTITGENQRHVALNQDGEYQVVPAPANKMTECWATFITPSGKEVYLASPHTPLNWGTAELRKAIGLLRILVERSEKKNRS